MLLYRYNIQKFDMSEEILDYSFDIHWEKPIENNDFSYYLKDIFERKDIVTIWEEHNHNSDQSFKEVQTYSEFIFHMYSRMLDGSDFRKVFRDIDQEIQWYPEDLLKWDEFKWFALDFFSQWFDFTNSSSRIMSKYIIPEARKSAYTDIIIEWFSENNPSNNYHLSTDKTGYLLLMLSAMIHNIKIHGAFDKRPVVWVFNIAWEFIGKVDEIKGKNPWAKIMTYNGAFHNMTIPMEWRKEFLGTTLNYEDLTFAPEFNDKYRDRYLSLDIVDWWSQTEKQSHFSVLKWKALDEKINIVSHSEWQTAIVLPKNWVDIKWRMAEIMKKTS